MEAVQFAHAELVIHRDLKPSNILVTAEGRVVLLDFGIGKLLTEETAEETELTQMSGRLFTPGYASPEQIGGQPLTTASDIYSLGVVLYELLTGVRPYRLKYDSRAALEQAILKEDLRRPSQNRFSPQVSAARGTSERALVRSLTGDLDTIVLKALKRNPLERYASVSAFAQDIINHLHNLPVSARPDSLWYRMGRFTARYKVPVAAASVAVLALLARLRGRNLAGTLRGCRARSRGRVRIAQRSGHGVPRQDDHRRSRVADADHRERAADAQREARAERRERQPGEPRGGARNDCRALHLRLTTSSALSPCSRARCSWWRNLATRHCARG